MGCCCSVKNPGNQSLGRQVECPRCGRTFPPTTTNYLVLYILKQFNEHLDSCLMGSQLNQVHPEDYQGITYWEKIQVGQAYSWVQKTYNPNTKINESNISREGFGQKQVWFRAKLEKQRIPWQNGCTVIKIQQNQLLESSIAAILSLKSRLLHGEIKLKFEEDTIVQDAGGLLREWSTQIFQCLVKLGYLMKTDTEEVMYRLNPNPTGDGGDQRTNVDKRQLFSLLGIVIGKSLFERMPIPAYLDRTLIKQILGQKVVLADMVYFDTELHNAWQYIMKNDLDNLLLNFSIEHGGKTIILKPNGDQLMVTSDNVKEYVDLCVQFYSNKSLEPYLQDFLTGLYQVIPKSLIHVFNVEELEMLLFGLPFIDVADWNKHTTYKDCSKTNQHIIWFWDVLESWSQEELSKFLRFCTGSTRVPVEGFSKLESNRGEVAYFCIQSPEYDSNNPYPKAHTCFNRLELPKYPSKELLEMYMRATLNDALHGQFGLE